MTLGSLSQGDAGEKRYQLEAHIGEPGKAAFLKGLHVTLGENQPFFVGGQSYQGGTLFLELRGRAVGSWSCQVAAFSPCRGGCGNEDPRCSPARRTDR